MSDHPFLLTISKNEAVYIVQALTKAVEDVYRQQSCFVKMAVPGENNLAGLTEYYERRALDLQTLIVKYKKAFL